MSPSSNNDLGGGGFVSPKESQKQKKKKEEMGTFSQANVFYSHKLFYNFHKIP